MPVSSKDLKLFDNVNQDNSHETSTRNKERVQDDKAKNMMTLIDAAQIEKRSGKEITRCAN